VNHNDLIAAGFVLRDGIYVKAGREVPHPKPECDAPPALDKVAARKAKGTERIVVRFVGHRNRLLDPDNFAGSIKDLLDGLRHAGLIPDDSPECIVLETSQTKCPRKDECTVIEILKP
jgi:hypothetical protein